MSDTPEYPQTIEASVRLLMSVVRPREQDRIAAMSENQLTALHMSLGLWLRNYLGLWKGNQALLDDSGQAHPDDASMVIVRAFWQSVRNERDLASPTLH